MIYYKIKDIRELKKLTVGFVASELQIAVATYIAVENGEVDIKLSRLYLIAEIFRVLPCDLFYCTGTYLAEKKQGNLHDTAQVKGLFYSPFSDKVEENYIVKLTEENRRLRERLF